MNTDNQTNTMPSVDVGGKKYTVLYDPNLSLEARQEINETINKSMSSNYSDVYEMIAIREALDDDRLLVPENDAKVLNAITEDYIEIQ